MGLNETRKTKISERRKRDEVKQEIKKVFGKRGRDGQGGRR